MSNDKRTLADSINHICEIYKQDQNCLTKHDLNNLETLRRDANWLLVESYQGPMDSPRHHRAFDRMHALLEKLKKKCADYHHQKKWRDELLRQSKYNPYHKPAGSPEGGEFDFAPGGSDSGGNPGGSSPSGGESVRKPGAGERIPGSSPTAADEAPKPKPKPFKAENAVQHAVSHAKPKPPGPGTGQCAKYVRQAIAAGGVEIPKDLYKESAKDYGSTLENEKVGFHAQVRVSTGKGYPPAGYEPQPGDVAVIQGTSKSKDGHMALYAGRDSKGKEIWISDFIQAGGAYPGPSYRSEKPSYVIYRHPLLTN